MPLLPVAGELSYGGVAFGPYTRTKGVDIAAVPDPANRTVMASQFTFDFTTYVTADAPGTTDAQVARMRQALMKNGDVFVYTGRGLGDIRINTGKVRDVAWGPWPKVARLRPHGQNAVQFDWRLVVTIPDCADAVYAGSPSAFTFRVTYDVDDGGYTTRTIRGTLTVPATRTRPGSNDLPDTADAYRDDLDPPLVPGFRRRYGPRVVDEAKTSLAFEIVDEEMGANIPPAGVVDARAGHTVASTAAGLRLWNGLITGEYELTKRADPAVAVAGFLGLCNARVNYLKDRLAQSQDPGQQKGAYGILPVLFNFGEPTLYGRRRLATFAFAYTFTSSVQEVIGASGVWRPAPGSDWPKWAYELRRAGVMTPAGLADLQFRTADDTVVSLCGRDAEVDFGADQRPELRSAPFGPLDFKAARSQTANANFVAQVAAAFPSPKPTESYVYYENEVWLETDSGVVAVTSLPAKALDATTDLFGKFSDFAGAAWDAMTGAVPVYPATAASQTQGAAPGAGPPSPPPTAGGVNVIRRVVPGAVVYLTGRAMRVGYPVPPPRLVQVNGVAAVPSGRLDRGEGYGQGVKFAAGGDPCFTARWRLRYTLADYPKGTLPVPPNPFLTGA